MPRISTVTTPDTLTKATLDGIKAKIGMVPNLYATVAHAPSALNGLLALTDAVTKGVLNAKQREIISLVTAQVNACHYCLSAHTLLGKGAGLTNEGTLAARAGRADGAVDNAIAALARRIAEDRGHVSDADLAAARAAGLSDTQIVEVTANVALNVFTNFANNVAQTEIDFPKVDLTLAA